MTTDGDRYLDYTSGIGVTNTGHAHPAVSAAVAAQAVKLLHGQQNIVYHEPGLRLHARLAALAPAPDWGAFLCNSGAEAVEAAVKLARVATGRPVIVAFRGGFHGRTAQAMSLTTSRVTVRADFEPLPGSVYHAPYPDPYRGGGDDDALRVDLGSSHVVPVRPAGGSQAGRRVHHRARHRRGRLHRAAGMVPAATAGAGQRARHPAHRGRGPDRLRADRAVLGDGPLGRHAGHHRDGQGHRVGPAAVGCAGASRDARRAGRLARTAAPTAAMSWRAPRHSRRWT